MRVWVIPRISALRLRAARSIPVSTTRVPSAAVAPISTVDAVYQILIPILDMGSHYLAQQRSPVASPIIRVALLREWVMKGASVFFWMATPLSMVVSSIPGPFPVVRRPEVIEAVMGSLLVVVPQITGGSSTTSVA